MNAKKCKAIRRETQKYLAGCDVRHDGLVYKDTRKQTGWAFPQGWLKANFVRLALVGGPWYQEALTQARRVYARQALNVSDSFRYIYRKAKRYVA